MSSFRLLKNIPPSSLDGGPRRPKVVKTAKFPKFSLFAAAPGPKFSEPAPTFLRRFVAPVDLYKHVNFQVCSSLGLAVATSRISAEIRYAKTVCKLMQIFSPKPVEFVFSVSFMLFYTCDFVVWYSFD